MDKEFKPVSNLDKTFHMKEPTGGAYKKIKMLILKSATEPYKSKSSICNEFKLDPETSISNEYGTEQLYPLLAEALFIEKDSFDYDTLNLAEVNRAYNDFFSQLRSN